MGRAKGSARSKQSSLGGKQSSLGGAGLLPLLKPVGSAVGKYCNVPGSFWEGCPAADKDKVFRCIVEEFVALHDFGSRKSAAFRAKEMGESGTGSLEPGVASGDTLTICYPLPFLQFYYDANPIASVSATDAGPPADATIKEEHEREPRVKPPVFHYLQAVSSTLNTAGTRRGQYTNKYTCTIQMEKGVCGSAVTCYAAGDGKAETTSNAFSHIRDLAAKGCPAHAAVLSKLNLTNKKMVLVDGEHVSVMSFAEAFPHHVDYVWCRAAGLFGAKLRTKPAFRAYVHGASTSCSIRLCLCMAQLSPLPPLLPRLRATRCLSSP